MERNVRNVIIEIFMRKNVRRESHTTNAKKVWNSLFPLRIGDKVKFQLTGANKENEGIIVGTAGQTFSKQTLWEVQEKYSKMIYVYPDCKTIRRK